MNINKGNMIVVLALFLGVLLFVFLLVNRGDKLFQETGVVETSAPAIVDSSDLETVGEGLDQTDLNTMDAELNKLDSETSEF